MFAVVFSELSKHEVQLNVLLFILPKSFEEMLWNLHEDF